VLDVLVFVSVFAFFFFFFFFFFCVSVTGVVPLVPFVDGIILGLLMYFNNSGIGVVAAPIAFAAACATLILCPGNLRGFALKLELEAGAFAD